MVPFKKLRVSPRKDNQDSVIKRFDIQNSPNWVEALKYNEATGATWSGLIAPDKEDLLFAVGNKCTFTLKTRELNFFDLLDSLTMDDEARVHQHWLLNPSEYECALGHSE